MTPRHLSHIAALPRARARRIEVTFPPPHATPRSCFPLARAGHVDRANLSRASTHDVALIYDGNCSYLLTLYSLAFGNSESHPSWIHEGLRVIHVSSSEEEMGGGVRVVLMVWDEKMTRSRINQHPFAAEATVRCGGHNDRRIMTCPATSHRKPIFSVAVLELPALVPYTAVREECL
ncbi:hypothetical protein B0H13DRAFT_1918593 [Mycena leptocephala]|nr:hypothetical protein B0H13DRAFT_1918593 [Mycena leptocephala]